MTDVLVPPRVVAMWRGAIGAGDAVLEPGTRTVVSGSRGMCPPGWTGVLRLGDAVVIERGGASDAVIDTLLELPDPTDSEAVLARIDAEQTLGPGVLSYNPDHETAAAARSAGQTAMLVDEPTTLRSWLARLPADDVSESSADELDRAFAVRVDDEPVAVAGWLLWPHDVAHLGVLVDPAHRGRGLSLVAGAAATVAALQEGLEPQWRAAETNAASRRVAVRIGYVESGRQFSLRGPKRRES